MEISINHNKSNLEAYNLIARQYAGDEPGEDDPVMRKSCRDLFANALEGKRVLEIGCGPGVDASFFHAAGLDVTATDFCEEFIKIITERFPFLNAHKMDMTNPDLPSGSFDGIYAFASFTHIPRVNALQTLQGFRKLLRSPGVLFLSLVKSSRYSEYVIDNWGGHLDNQVLFTCYQPNEIESLLGEAGFRKIQFHQVGSKVYETLPRLLERGVSHFQVVAST